VHETHVEISNALFAVSFYNLINDACIAVDVRPAFREMIASDFEIFKRMICGIVDGKVGHHYVVKPALAPMEIKFDLLKKHVFRRGR
jgi:hypothetical protein